MCDCEDDGYARSERALRAESARTLLPRLRSQVGEQVGRLADSGVPVSGASLVTVNVTLAQANALFAILEHTETDI